MFNSTYYSELSNEVAVRWGGENYPQKRNILRILCVITSFISLIGSCYIICHISCRGRRERKRNLSNAFNQLLLGLSVSDVISSFAFFFSTWAFPTDGIDASFFVGSAGTESTCIAQGFLITVGYSAAGFFTVLISVQHVLIVRYGIHNRTLKKIQPFFFFFATAIPLSIGIFYLLKYPFTPSGIFCFITSPYPYFCAWAEKDRMDECTIRDVPGSYKVAVLLHSIYASLTGIAIVCCMIILFLTVRRQETMTRRWTNEERNRSKSMNVANRAFQYIGAFLLVNVPPSVAAFYNETWISGLVIAICLPLQGLLNALIYSKYIDKIVKRVRLSFGAVSSSAFTVSDGKHSDRVKDSRRISNVDKRLRLSFGAMSSSAFIVSGGKHSDRVKDSRRISNVEGDKEKKILYGSLSDVFSDRIIQELEMDSNNYDGSACSNEEGRTNENICIGNEGDLSTSSSTNPQKDAGLVMPSPESSTELNSVACGIIQIVEGENSHKNDDNSADMNQKRNNLHDSLVDPKISKKDDASTTGIKNNQKVAASICLPNNTTVCTEGMHQGLSREQDASQYKSKEDSQGIMENDKQNIEHNA